MNLQTPGSLIGPPMVLGQYELHDKDTAIYYTLEIFGVWEEGGGVFGSPKLNI